MTGQGTSRRSGYRESSSSMATPSSAPALRSLPSMCSAMGWSCPNTSPDASCGAGRRGLVRNRFAHHSLMAHQPVVALQKAPPGKMPRLRIPKHRHNVPPRQGFRGGERMAIEPAFNSAAQNIR